MRHEYGELEREVHGVVLAGDDARASVELTGFNTAVSHRPKVIVGAACEADIERAVSFATAHDLGVAVMSTGHGQFLPADDAVLITTRRMGSVVVDPSARSATLQAGVRWRQVLDVAAEHGLAPLSGSSSAVGAIGYLLGGGLGLVARKHGFAADHIVTLRVVGADGCAHDVNADTDPELFWAIRGGKSNFGVISEVTIRLFPISEVLAGTAYVDAASIGPVLRQYAAWTNDLPEEITSSVAVLRLPDQPDVPAPLRGRTVGHVRFVACHEDADARAGARELLDELLAVGTVLWQDVGPRRYCELDHIHADPTDPVPIWQRSGQLRSLDATTIEAILNAVGPETECPLAMVEIRHLGGALERAAEPANAVAGRDGAFSILFLGLRFPDIADDVVRSGEAAVQQIRPHMTGRSLLNWLGCATSSEDVCAAWDEPERHRLLAAKQRLDPNNVFRYGHPLVAIGESVRREA